MAVDVLKNASVTVNAVDLSAYVTNVVVDRQVDPVETTSMGATGHTFTAGLQSSTVTVNFNQDFALTKVNATLTGLVGTTTSVVVKATADAVSATNPSFTCSGFFAGYAPVNGAVGDLNAFTATFTGPITVATS
jgi:hypothetical protein